MKLPGFPRRGASPNAMNCCPAGTPEEVRAGVPPKPRPGPGPVALYRNWISYAGTGIVAVGVLVFVVLTAYHTIGGGALNYPYGDLVIFFLPPMFVIAGVAVVLIGMYVQWIRWRMHKPLSFARFPKWDLNLASERKALLSVAVGAAIISVPAVYGGYQAYLYTDDVSFCGAVCHSMTPEFVTYRLSPHAHVTCAQCHVGPGATGYVESKIRGMVELVETIQNDYPRPIPAPVTALHTIQSELRAMSLAVKFLRHARSAPSAFHVRRAEHALGDRLAGFRRRPRGFGGGADGDSLARREQGRVRRERRRTAEYFLGAIRGPEDRHGEGLHLAGERVQRAYLRVRSEPWIAWIVTTVPATSCNRRTRAWMRRWPAGRSMPLSLTSSSRALPRSQALMRSREQAMQAIDETLRSYYQKNYPQIYADKQPAIDAAIAYLQDTYDKYYFPVDEGALGHIFHERRSLSIRWDASAATTASTRAWTEASFAPIATTATRILRQGKTGEHAICQGAGGADFRASRRHRRTFGGSSRAALATQEDRSDPDAQKNPDLSRETALAWRTHAKGVGPSVGATGRGLRDSTSAEGIFKACNLGGAHEWKSNLEDCGFHVDLDRRRNPQPRGMGIYRLRDPGT